MLPDKEKEWVLQVSGYSKTDAADGKSLYCYKSCVDEFPYTVTH